jgi:hypothetical protein
VQQTAIEKEVTVSPQAKDMTDKQRCWWFAHLDEEKTSQGSRTEPPRRSRYLTEAQRRRIEERKEAALGRMRGWAYVSGKNVQYQPRDTLEHHYEQGFKEGVTDAGEWITGMWGLAEMLGEIVRKVRNALADWLEPPESEPFAPGVVKQTRPSTKGDLKRYTPDELARRLGSTRDDFHRDIKEAMKKFRNELKQIGNPRNPDILVDRAGNVWLQNPVTRKAINTGRSLDDFKK